MAVISPITGVRITPTDGYHFVRGTTAVFRIIFQNSNMPVTVDNTTVPTAFILAPLFLSNNNLTPSPIATLTGSLTSGQQYEYEFSWDIPANQLPQDEYIITYNGILGGITYNFGDEYFTIDAGASQIGIKTPGYATISDIRMMKTNIDDYLPDVYKEDLTARNNLIEFHLNQSSNKLRGELALFRQKGNNENFRSFCIYYTIYLILLSGRGEDGSSVADQNLNFWKSEAMAILAQEKRMSLGMGIPYSRS